jgi:hypothetical protein
MQLVVDKQMLIVNNPNIILLRINKSFMLRYHLIELLCFSGKIIQTLINVLALVMTIDLSQLLPLTNPPQKGNSNSPQPNPL